MLGKGLNYAPTPDKIPVEEYIVATELACQKLPNNEAMVLRSEMAGVLRNAKPPKSNITREERKALQDLKKEESVLILPADKGKATVLRMSRTMRISLLRCYWMKRHTNSSLLILSSATKENLWPYLVD